MLVREVKYEDKRAKKTLDMLLVGKKNEFKALAESLFRNVPASMNPIIDWEKFVLNFCLDVSKAFSEWTGKTDLSINADLKALTILRQLSRDKSSMIQMTHLLNIAYDIAEDFKIIYKRIE